MKRLLLLVALLPCLSLAQVPAAYRGTVLHTGSWSHVALNDLGQVGFSTSDGRPMLWDAVRGATPLPGDVGGVLLFGINNAGTVVGTGSAAWIGDTRPQPLVWQGGADAARVAVAGQEGEAKGINSHGVIVGNTGDVFAPGGWFGFIHGDSGSVYFDDFHPTAINDAGEVVGNGPFGVRRWQDGQLQYVDTTPGATAFALNSLGWIAGAILNETWRATLWRPGELVEYLGPGFAYDVNDSGVAVGTALGHAMLWYQGGAYLLDDLWQQAQPGEWSLLSAEAVN